MTKITLNSETVALLQSVSSEVEVCDDAGNVLGWYAPAKAQEKTPSAQELIDSCPLSEDELLERAEQARTLKGRTWREIKRDLESR